MFFFSILLSTVRFPHVNTLYLLVYKHIIAKQYHQIFHRRLIPIHALSEFSDKYEITDSARSTKTENKICLIKELLKIYNLSFPAWYENNPDFHKTQVPDGWVKASSASDNIIDPFKEKR